jgi:hypothetical protein
MALALYKSPALTKRLIETKPKHLPEFLILQEAQLMIANYCNPDHPDYRPEVERFAWNYKADFRGIMAEVSRYKRAKKESKNGQDKTVLFRQAINRYIDQVELYIEFHYLQVFSKEGLPFDRYEEGEAKQLGTLKRKRGEIEQSKEFIQDWQKLVTQGYMTQEEMDEKVKYEHLEHNTDLVKLLSERKPGPYSHPDDLPLVKELRRKKKRERKEKKRGEKRKRQESKESKSKKQKV